MRDTVSFLSRFYLMAAVWFAVLAGTSLALTGLMDPVYTAAELSPVTRAALTLALGFTAATTAAVLGWSWLARRSMGVVGPSRMRGERIDGAAAGDFVASRPSFRP